VCLSFNVERSNPVLSGRRDPSNHHCTVLCLNFRTKPDTSTDLLNLRFQLTQEVVTFEMAKSSRQSTLTVCQLTISVIFIIIANLLEIVVNFICA
jgi:hypothetical protein